MKIKSKNKPIIGISSNLLLIDQGPFVGQKRIYVNQGYVDSVIKAGGTPILLPMLENSDAILSQLTLIDGLILSGGHDVDPSHYGEEPHPLLQEILPERDAFEMNLLKNAHKQKKPIFGICRGLQLMNVFFGGTLYQDLSLRPTNKEVKHLHREMSNLHSHQIELEPEGLLHKIFGAKNIVTNSFHHQAIKDLAPGFAVLARAQDGLIESIARTDSHWTVGVQWHPEIMMHDSHTDMQKLFEAFIDASTKV